MTRYAFLLVFWQQQNRAFIAFGHRRWHGTKRGQQGKKNLKQAALKLSQHEALSV